MSTQGPPALLPSAPPSTEAPPSTPPAPPSDPPSTEAPPSAPPAPLSAPEEAGVNNVQVPPVLGQARVSLPVQGGPSTSAAAANSRRRFHPHGRQNPANNDPISQTGEAPPGQELAGVTQRLDWPSPTVGYVVPLRKGQDIAQELHDFTHLVQGFRRGVSFSVVAANGLVRDPSLITPERTHTFPGLYIIAGLQGIILPRYDESDRLIDVVSFLTISLSKDGALIGGCLDISPHRPLQSAGRGFIILSMLHENVSRSLVQLIAASVAAASSDDEEEED